MRTIPTLHPVLDLQAFQKSMEQASEAIIGFATVASDAMESAECEPCLVPLRNRKVKVKR